MSASGLPFHSTMRPYATGVPAGIALTLTVTFHFSFAYSANALSAASWMNFDTGVIRASSPSIGACAQAVPRAPATSSTASARIATCLIDRLLSCRGPPFRSLHRPPPPVATRRARRRIERGREPALQRPPPAHLVERAPHAGAQPGQVGGAQPGRLDDARPQHGDARDVGLELAQEVVDRGAAVHAQLP